MSGVLLLPLVGALAISSGLGGWYMRATGRFREVIIFGMFFITLGYGLYMDLKPYASWARIVLYQVVVGVGLGPNFQATLIALQANVKTSEMSQATAAFSLVRQLAASVSVVVGTVIYNHEVAGGRPSWWRLWGTPLELKSLLHPLLHLASRKECLSMSVKSFSTLSTRASRMFGCSIFVFQPSV